MKGKYITIILLLIFIFIGEVKADSCVNLYSQYWNDSNAKINTAGNPGYISQNKTFTSPINIANNFNYIKVPMYIVLTSQQNIISNINLYETCTNATNVFDSYVITYQDGSTASIDAENYRTICNQYNTNGNATLPYEPEVQNVVLRLTYGSGGVILCDLDSNLMATCKIPSGTTNLSITGYQFAFTLSKQSSTIQAGFAGGIYNLCKDSNTQMIEQQEQTNTKLDNIDNSINSSNTSGGESAADDLKNNSAFQDNTGLSSIVTAPLSMINSLTSTCSPIRLPIPYLDTTIELPCIGDLLTSKMGELMQLVKVVINGYICYLIGLDMFKIVKHARDPNDDRIEVLDL